MIEKMTVKIRSKTGEPIRLDELARQIEQAGCMIVSVPLHGARVRKDKPTRRWPPLAQ